MGPLHGLIGTPSRSSNCLFICHLPRAKDDGLAQKHSHAVRGRRRAIRHAAFHPYYSDIFSSVTIEGQQGKPAETSRFVVGIVNVYRARQLTTPGIGSTRAYNTDGEWLVIEAAAKAKIESLGLAAVEWLGPNGIRYAMSKRPTYAPGIVGSERLEPGIPRPILMVFELPRDQIAGGKLLIAESSLTLFQNRCRSA